MSGWNKRSHGAHPMSFVGFRYKSTLNPQDDAGAERALLFRGTRTSKKKVTLPKVAIQATTQQEEDEQ